MNEYFQENKRSLLMLTALFFVLAIVLYFLLLRPLMTDLSSQERAIDAKKADIELLEAQLENMKEQMTEEDPEQLVLENKIPTERKLDDYILSLEQLEEKTSSQIDHIDFAYDSSIELVDEEDEPESEDAEDDQDVDESTIDQEIIQDKPDELQVMTVRFTATSPSFDQFIELLKVIENEERISIVSHLSFQQPTEYNNEEDQDDETVSFNVDLTTFCYME